MTDITPSPVFSVNFYIIHVETFKYRKLTIDRLVEVFTKDPRFNVKFEFITEFDPHLITQDDIRKTVNYEPINDEQLAAFNGFLKNMHINQLSNAMKHKKALELISDNVDVDFSIVLEDDVIFNDNIIDSLYSLLLNIPETYDIMFLGLPSSKDAEGTYHQKLLDVFKVLPCCESYIVSKKTSTILNETYLPIKFSNNIHMSYLISKLNLEAYLSIPNVFIDGSKLGLYFSSLEVNNRLIFNQDYVILSRLLEKEESFTSNQRQEIDNAFKNVKLKTNPEFYYLKALYEAKKGNYDFAEAIFNYTYELFENNGAVLNNQSLFLRDFMRVFKHQQSV